jgi:hypothetical protein
VTTPTPPNLQQRVRYVYHFTDFMTGTLRASLPMRDAQLNDVLGGVGKAQGVVPLLDRAAAGQDVAAATIPRRTCLWAERQVLDAQRRILTSTVPWGGPVMSRARNRTGRTLTVGAVSWESYLSKRVLRDDLVVTQWDKGRIWRELLQAAFAGEPAAGTPADPDNPWSTGARPTAPIWNQPGTFAHNADDGTFLPAAPVALTGVLADRTYVGTDLKPFLDAVTSLAASGDGFDWHLTPFRDPVSGQFGVRPDIGYPRLGRTQPADLVWSDVAGQSRAGYLEDYTLTEDGSAVLNRIVALGSGQPPDQIRATAANFEEGYFGYPPYDGSLASSSTDDLTTYNAVFQHAQGALGAGLASSVVVSGIKVRGDLFPYLDRYAVADDATLRLNDPLTGQTLTVVGQIVGRSITPPQQGRAEGVALDVQGQRAALVGTWAA